MATDFRSFRAGAGAARTVSAAADSRVDFLRRTYAHLAGAIAAFALLSAYLVVNHGETILMSLGRSRGAWGVVLLAFAGIGWVAERLVSALDSPAKQYAGLGFYIVAEAVVFTPMLTLAAVYAPPQAHVLSTAAVLTGVVFGGLTAVVFVTRRDFSMLRGALTVASLVAMGLVICSLLFGFQLGMLFAAGMILIAAGQILYTTSNVLRTYPEGAHVAAALSLFASVALLFYYILRVLLSLAGRRN